MAKSLIGFKFYALNEIWSYKYNGNLIFFIVFKFGIFKLGHWLKLSATNRNHPYIMSLTSLLVLGILGSITNTGKNCVALHCLDHTSVRHKDINNKIIN